MEEPPGFDEDALLNDYYDDYHDFPPPPPEEEYDEQLMMEDAVENQGGQQQPPPPPSSSTAANDATASATSRPPGSVTITPTTTTALPVQEEQEDDYGLRDDHDDDDFQDASQVYAERQKSKDVVFAFERYNPKATSSCWRREKVDSPNSNTMKAKAWKTAADITTSKKRLNDYSDDDDDDDMDMGDHRPLQRRRRKEQAAATTTTEMPTAPDSQLLYFLSKPPLSSRTSCLAVPRTHMLSRPVPGQATRSMTLGNGHRVHMRVRDDETTIGGGGGGLNKATSSSRYYSKNSHCALGISMADLMRRVQAMRRRHEHENPRRHRHRHNRRSSSTNDEKDDDDDDDDSTRDTSPTKSATTNNNTNNDTNSQLWVDKHAPHSFLHLLSNEKTNREVIRALRAWDKYVFHREPPSRPDFFVNNNNNNNQNGAAAGSNINKSSSPNKQKQYVSQQQHPKDTRPEASSRVLLLSGPPGVGKSTLAHIVARHCGYRPLEVNGSDERSASVLTERVTRAMESQTLDNMMTVASSSSSDGDSGGNGRPNCLILDEIDGADAKGAIQALVDIIRAERGASSSSKSSSSANANKKGNGKGKKKKVTYLRRPIIFICNNKYAPALQPLLPYCRQFHVNPPSSTRLVARLRSVLTAEGMSVVGNSAALLHQLVATSGGDIRSCLYTLQFAAAKAKRMAEKAYTANTTNTSKLGKEVVVDISETLSASLSGKGLKDARSDIYGVVSSVFTTNRAQHKKQNGWSSSSDRILNLLQSFGDNSRTLDCLFLNVMNVSYIDPTMDKCAAAHEWLSLADGTARSHDGVESSAAAAVHLLCRVEQQRQLDLVYSTRTMSQARYDRESNQALAMRFIQGLDPHATRCTRCASSLVAMETTPYTLWILSAGNAAGCLDRAASNVDLLNDRERQAFDSHVGVLSSLGLKYVAKEENENQDAVERRKQHEMARRLEPPIEKFVQFQDLASCERKEIPTQLKDLLAQRAAHDRLHKRRVDNEAAVSKQDDTGSKDSDPPSSKTSLSALDSTVTSSSPSNARDLGTRDEPVEKAIDEESPNKRAADLTQLVNAKQIPPAKRQKADAAATTKSSSSITSANFLGVGARKAKAARTAQKLARAGFQRSNKNKHSHTGSGVPLRQAMRLKYVKGFTQAVRVPCRLEDLN